MSFKRILVWLCLLCGAVNGYAFKVQYGNFFTIDRVRVKQGVVVLPLTRAKHEDVRILDSTTLEYVKSCGALNDKEVCRQDAAAVPLRAGTIIPLPAEKGCRWLVPVVFNEQWLVRITAVKNGAQEELIYPPVFGFVKVGKGPKNKKSAGKSPTEFEKQVFDFIQHKLREVSDYEMCARADR